MSAGAFCQCRTCNTLREAAATGEGKSLVLLGDAERLHAEIAELRSELETVNSRLAYLESKKR